MVPGMLFVTDDNDMRLEKTIDKCFKTQDEVSTALDNTST